MRYANKAARYVYAFSYLLQDRTAGLGVRHGDGV
jgi:hypothetical protein